MSDKTVVASLLTQAGKLEHAVESVKTEEWTLAEKRLVLESLAILMRRTVTFMQAHGLDDVI